MTKRYQSTFSTERYGISIKAYSPSAVTVFPSIFRDINRAAQTVVSCNYKRFERGEWKLPGEETEKDMTFEQYTAWLMQAQAARRAYLCGEISGMEFEKNILGC